MKIIVITESQYGRLFLNEQTAYERHLDRAYSTPEGARKQNKANREMVQALSKFWDEHKHEIIDVASIVVLFIPVAGPFISAGLELVNAGLYYSEGDEMMAGFSALLAVVPGGMAIRRSLKASGVLKGIDKATQSVIKAQQKGYTISKAVVEKKIKKEIGEKAFKQNAEMIVKYFDEVIPAMTKQTVQASAKSLDELISKTSKYWLEFLNSKHFTKLLAKNGDDMYKAYLAFLRRLAVIDGTIGSILMGTLMTYEDEVANGINFVIEEVPGIQKLIKWEMNRRLSNDADEGNISSIVKRDGYNWEQIKEVFMVTPYKENKEQNFNDNVLLKKAWKSGWRPDKNPFVPMEYQTEKYKGWFNDNFSGMESIDPETMQGSIEALSNKEISSELENYFDK
jgi:hypothetical protein